MDIIKLYYYYINFEWKEGKNWKISNFIYKKQLLKTIIIDIFHINMIYWISKYFSKNVFKRNCFNSLRRNEKIVFNKVILWKLNEIIKFLLLKSEKYIIKI